jgi:hypothetical protein
MKKLFGVCAVLIAMISPVLAQDEDHHRDDDRRQEQRRILSPDDQRKFDSYYSRWLEYRRDRNHEQVESMEKRMRHVMERNHISPDTPFDVVASNGDRDRDHDRDDRH